MRAYNPNGISIGSAVFAQMTAVSYWRYFDFSRCRSPLSWIFKFLKYLTVGRLKRVELRQRAKFRGIGDISTFQDDRRRYHGFLNF